MNSPYLYLRALRQAEHTVFCVQEGQKNYYHPQFNTRVPFSSGQQVKRSILEAVTAQLRTTVAPITFNYEISKKGELGMGEPWSPCDPSYPDQLLGGWMKAATGEITVKRRSPLSISAMRPLHPLLGTVSRENITFDRSDNPDHHPIRVRDADGNLLSEKEIIEFLASNNRTLGRRTWVADQTRSSGLFVYDVAVDKRTLFSVSLNQHEPELHEAIITKLRSEGWTESKNIFGKCLVCPKQHRHEVIEALAYGLVNWRITSNQSRTFSLMETLAVAVSDNANKVASAIRAKLSEETTQQRAVPVIDDTVGADLYITLPCEGYISGVAGSANALDQAERKIKDVLLAFDYEKQL
ncbi:MAG: CRISPR-associated protein Cas7 [Ignavibacteria bacterium]|nr:CRISPR-associated protein Cas7 [Ignavibacteria bacterium]